MAAPAQDPPRFNGGEVFEAVGLPDPLEAVARIHSSRRMQPRVRMGLLYLLEGATYREAARAVGLQTHQDLHRTAQRLGIADLHEARRQERERITSSVRELEKSGVAAEVIRRGKAGLRDLVRML